MEAVTLLCGDARAMLAGLPAQSAHTCITSPSYFGLRDYGCAGQIGLEQTPQEYVAALVDVFAAVHRVLRADGTLWVVLGDSYNSAAGGGNTKLAAWSAIHPSGKGGGHKQGALSRQPLKTPTLPAKSLLGIPWRVAFALQDDGWLLRQELIWHKPNPMPESVKDRCTRGHETVFMLAKRPAYYYDADAIRECGSPTSHGGGRHDGARRHTLTGTGGRHGGLDTARSAGDGGRNKRSVWTCATSPLSSKTYGVDTDHYAAFPPELVRPMVRAATSERGVCPQCGAPWRRVVEHQRGDAEAYQRPKHLQSRKSTLSLSGNGSAEWAARGGKVLSTGWQAGCSCDAGAPVPATVLDCFCGSGTTGLVAAQEGRGFVGIDLNPQYVALARARIATVQPALFSGVATQAAV